MVGRLVPAMLLLAIVAPPAAAAGCREARGDADPGNAAGVRTGRNLPHLDIVSGDLASDGKDVTTVIRVLDLGDPAGSTYGRYSFFFTSGGYRIGMHVIDDPVLLAPTGEYTVDGQRRGSLHVRVDPGRGELRAYLPFSGLGLRRGDRVRDLLVQTYSYGSAPVDEARCR